MNDAVRPSLAQKPDESLLQPSPDMISSTRPRSSSYCSKDADPNLLSIGVKKDCAGSSMPSEPNSRVTIAFRSIEYASAWRTAWESNGKTELFSQIASRLPVCASASDRVPGMPASIWPITSSCGLG